MTADTLPDDVILEILVRVPEAPALLRCAATCRRWRTLVSDPSFLRRRWPDNAYFLLGSFVLKKLNRGDKASCLTGPTPRSALAAGGSRLLSSFVSDVASLPADYVWPLTSHGGLLLLKLFSNSPEPVDGVPLAVCSLLAGTCDVMPLFKRYMYCSGHAVLSSPDCRPLFKVLMIEAGADKTDFVLHTFVAGQPSWNAPAMYPSRAAIGFIMHSEAVLCQGKAHWLFCASSTLHVLCVDTETGLVSSTELRSPTSSLPHLDGRRRSRLATTTDGKLLSLCL
jgi:hypothetical protein